MRKQTRKTNSRDIQVGPQFRAATLRALEPNGDADGALRAELTFSSEQPVERYDWWDGAFNEVLDHKPESVRMARMTQGAAVLMDHDHRSQIGVVESAEIRNGRGHAVVRLSSNVRNHPAHGDLWQDVLDGIRRNVSVGYRIFEAVREVKSEDGPDTFRVTDWEPFEISLVSVPADTSVGISRSARTDERNNLSIQGIPAMDDDEVLAPEKPAAAPAPESRAQVTERIDQAVARERARVAGINAMASRICRMQGITDHEGVRNAAQNAIEKNVPEHEFAAQALERFGIAKPVEGDGRIGLSLTEAKRFSFRKLINALANPQNQSAQRAAAYEFDVCSGRESDKGDESSGERGTSIPADILTAPMFQLRDLPAPMRRSIMAERDITISLSASTGDSVVQTDLLAASFIDLLRNALVMRTLGIRILDGLQGNVAIPRQTGGATAYWVAETGAITESTPAFDQVTMTPHTMGAFVDISRRALTQPAVSMEAIVVADLVAVLAREADRVMINGDPDTTATVNEPRGILNTSGIGSVAGGTNGAAPDRDDIINLMTEIEIDNAAMGSLAYLTNYKVKGKLQRTRVDTGSGVFLWPTGGTELNGYPVGLTNAVPSNLTKGSATAVCSAIIAGNFDDFILGLWTGLDILVDPYTLGTSGAVRTIVFQDIDTAVRHAQSFAAMKDALTT